MKEAVRLDSKPEQSGATHGETLGLLLIGSLFGFGALYEAVQTAASAMTGPGDAWLIHFIPAAISAGMAAACFLLVRTKTVPTTKE